MFRKSLTGLLILVLTFALLIPTQAFAGAKGTETKTEIGSFESAGNKQYISPGFTDDKSNPDSNERDYNNKQTGKGDEAVSLPWDPGEAEVMIPDEPEGTTSMALSPQTAAPTKYTASLKWDSKGHFYYKFYTLISDTAGFFSFKSLSPAKDDTDVFLFDQYGNLVGDKNDNSPFDLDYFIQANTFYSVAIVNTGSHSSVSYIITAPINPGTAGFKITSNGYTGEWEQSFTINTADWGVNTLYLNFPENQFVCNCWIYDSNLNEIYNERFWDRDPRYRPKLTGSSTYYVKFSFFNIDSKYDTYTVIVEDGTSSTEGMKVGQTYTNSFTADDYIVSNVMIPNVSCKYRFLCDRPDAKLTVYEGGGHYTIFESTTDTDVYLQNYNTYYIYYVTTDATGPINYSVTRLPCEECNKNSVSPSFSGNIYTAFKTVPKDQSSITVDATVSYNATWALYSDNECKEEIADKTLTLNEGTNFAYLKVTAEDGIHTAVYPLLIFRPSDSIGPAIYAYDGINEGIENGGAVNKNVYIITLGASNIKVNGNDFIYWWDPIHAEGVYTFTAKDTNNHTTTFTFTIDKTSPILPLKKEDNSRVLYNDIVNSTVTAEACIDATTTVSMATKDGEDYPWPDGGVFTEDGSYSITSTDAAGNSSEMKFTIDRTSPVINAECSSVSVDNGGYANGSVVVSVKDDHLQSKTVKKNNASIAWPSNNTFTTPGTYTITAADSVGNAPTVFTFTIDKTLPVITAKDSNKKTVSNNGVTKYNVTVTVNDAYLSSKTVTKDSIDYIWPGGSLFTEEGRYIITAQDSAGNSTVFTFNIDRTVPVITAVSGTAGISSGANVNTDVTVTVSDANFSSRSVKKNGHSMSWPSGGVFTASGSYVVSAKDKVGNTSTFSFIIDKTSPSISVKPVKGSALKNGGATKYDVTVKVSDSYLTSKSITRNGDAISWPGSNKFTLEGVYIATAEDIAGNISNFTFTLDKPAVITVTETVSADAVVNKGFTNEAVTINYTDQFFTSKTLKKDGATIEWPVDNTVSDEGVYIVTVSDAIGNISTFTFTVDKTKPAITAKAYSGADITDEGTTSESRVTVSVSDKNLYSKSVTRNDVKIKWPSNGRFTNEGVYIVTAVDNAGNVSTFKFTIDRML